MRKGRYIPCATARAWNIPGIVSQAPNAGLLALRVVRRAWEAIVRPVVDGSPYIGCKWEWGPEGGHGFERMLTCSKRPWESGARRRKYPGKLEL